MFEQIFYHLERCLIYSILTTVHPSFFSPISLERCETKENINTSWLSIRWSPPGGMTWLLETKINNVTRSCLFKLPWIPLEFSGSFQVNWISKLNMASWALNSFVNLFFCNFKINSWHFCSNQSINLINVSVWIHSKKCNFQLVFPERNISLVVKEQKTKPCNC